MFSLFNSSMTSASSNICFFVSLTAAASAFDSSATATPNFTTCFLVSVRACLVFLEATKVNVPPSLLSITASAPNSNSSALAWPPLTSNLPPISGVVSTSSWSTPSPSELVISKIPFTSVMVFLGAFNLPLTATKLFFLTSNTVPSPNSTTPPASITQVCFSSTLTLFLLPINLATRFNNSNRPEGSFSKSNLSSSSISWTDSSSVDLVSASLASFFLSFLNVLRMLLKLSTKLFPFAFSTSKLNWASPAVEVCTAAAVLMLHQFLGLASEMSSQSGSDGKPSFAKAAAIVVEVSTVSERRRRRPPSLATLIPFLAT